MNQHLSEQQLLDFRFELCADTRRREIEQHLAGCAECRARLEQLNAKFAALDSLKGEVAAPEKLIADTLRTIRISEPEPAVVFPRWAWVTGFAAAAALLMAVLYGGIMTGEQQPAAPAVRVALLEEEAPAPAARGIETDNVAMEEPQMEQRLAMPPPPLAAKGIMAKRTLKAETPKLQFYAADREYSRPDFGWMSRSGDDIAVQVFPALVESDEAVRRLPGESGKQIMQWSVSVSNRSDRASTALIEKDFGTLNWRVTASDPQVGVTTQNGTRARLTVEVPAQSAKSFTCTAIVPQEGEAP